MKSLNICTLGSSLLIWIWILWYLYMSFRPEIEPEWKGTKDYYETIRLHKKHGVDVSVQSIHDWTFENKKLQVCKLQ
jgi:hypothetical protein